MVMLRGLEDASHEREETLINRDAPRADVLIGRLRNWKFDTARKYLHQQPEAVRVAVKTLADMFGNSGWFGGKMGTMVDLVVEALCAKTSSPEPAAQDCCDARRAKVPGGSGFSVGAVLSGEVVLYLTVGCHEGTTFMSRELWAEIGRRGGWLDEPLDQEENKEKSP